jgi:hypothetical protein
VTNKELAFHILEQQYKLAGLTMEQALLLSPDEFDNIRITEQQSREWYIWAVDFVSKKKGWTKKTARKEVGMVDLMAGLIVNYD